MLMLISLQLGDAGTNMCCPELVPQITEKTRWQTNQCIMVRDHDDIGYMSHSRLQSKWLLDGLDGEKVTWRS